MRGARCMRSITIAREFFVPLGKFQRCPDVAGHALKPVPLAWVNPWSSVALRTAYRILRLGEWGAAVLHPYKEISFAS
jgi:hypothetical protein